MNQLNETSQSTATLGFFFARFIAEQAGEPMSGVLARSASWLSDIQAQGDVCLDLTLHAGQPWPNQQGQTPMLDKWCELLLKTTCVAGPGELAPMILDGHRLYLNRFWSYEDEVARSITARLSTAKSVNRELLQKGLQRLFHNHDVGEIDWQMLAAALSVTRSFSVISGGPGTGKTTSLVKVLALLLEQQPDMHIRMAAPTGKAAARMMESIRNAKAGIDTDEHTRNRIPDDASTIHRLLGFSPGGYRHNRNNPLMLDCLVIDEASMLDLPMMARLLGALPETASLILLGDRDQLASVDAGNVLGDITGHGHEICYRPDTARELAALTGIKVSQLPTSKHAPVIADAIALLRTSYRFNADSGIGRLARSINKGDGNSAVAILADASNIELAWLQGVSIESVVAQIIDAYSSYLQTDDVARALDLFEKQRVLCAVRNGPVGVQTINQTIAERLIGSGLLAGGTLAHGMPVMVTANNYELGLFNGDIGLLWRNNEGKLRAYFRQADNQLRDIPAQSLPQYELAWAMTVHKSQGSEFQHVILMLPEEGEGQAILTRELLYTAITRAREQFTLYGNAEAVKRAAIQTVNRSTGLSDRLKWPVIKIHTGPAEQLSLPME